MIGFDGFCGSSDPGPLIAGTKASERMAAGPAIADRDVRLSVVVSSYAIGGAEVFSHENAQRSCAGTILTLLRKADLLMQVNKRIRYTERTEAVLLTCMASDIENELRGEG